MKLTKQEVKVAQMMAQGLSDKEIANRMMTSVRTANFHVANILDKCSANNRMSAVIVLAGEGLVTLGKHGAN